MNLGLLGVEVRGSALKPFEEDFLAGGVGAGDEEAGGSREAESFSSALGTSFISNCLSCVFLGLGGG